MRALLIALLVSCSSPPAPAPAPPVAPTPAPAPDLKPPVTLNDRKPIELQLKKELTLAGDVSIQLTSYVVEEIEASPEDGALYPGGSGVVMQIEIDGETVTLSDVPAAYDPKRVAWTDDFRIELVAHGDHDPIAHVYVDRITDRPVADSQRALMLQRGDAKNMGGNIAIRFLGHSHKHVAAGGPSSPLIVSVAYSEYEGGKQLGEATYYLNPPDENTWTWRDYSVRLDDYSYGSVMELTVERLHLEQLAVATD